MKNRYRLSHSLIKIILASFWVLISLSGSPAFSSEKVSEINISCEAIPFLAQEDGTGLYLDIFKAVFEPAGIKVNSTLRSYIGAVSLLRKKEVDAVAGSYSNEINGALYPKNHFDLDVVVAIFKKDKIQWQGLESLKNRRVAWVKGYAYDAYLDFSVNKMEFNTRRDAINVLNSDKVDIMLDSETELKKLLDESKADIGKYGLEKALELKLYLAFADTEKGKQLLQIFDERFQSLIKSGEIKKIFDKWQGKTGIACPFK